MKKTLKFAGLLIVIVALLSFMTGCTHRVLDFTVVSSKNVNMNVDDTGRGDRVIGTDYIWWFPLCLFPMGTPNLKEAVDDAIENAGPDYDALIDGVIYSQGYYYVLTAKSGFKVEGTPINTKKLIAELEQNGEDVDATLAGLLYHSKTDKDNTMAIEKIGVIEVVYHEGK